MSRGGANPNWEWQLVHHDGHHTDEGLRQRRMITRGYKPPNKVQKEKKRVKKLAKEVGLDLKDLLALFPQKARKK